MPLLVMIVAVLGETPMLNFTEEESNAATQRFGCDCAGCINAVRQLQGKPLL